VIRELLIVVVGILIALAINSWWIGLEEKALEESYLELLRADLTRTAEQLAVAAAQQERHAQSVLMVIAASRSSEPPVNDSLITWLGEAGSTSDPIPTLSVAQGLVSTGDLRVIRSDAVRNGVVLLLDRVRLSEARLVEYEQRVIESLQSINRHAEALDRGRGRWVGVFGSPPDSLSRGTRLEGAATADLVVLLRVSEFRALLDELFLGHENARMTQLTILNATRSLLTEVERAQRAP